MIELPVAAAADPVSQIERDTVATMTRTSWRYWVGLAAAASLVALGGWAWSTIAVSPRRWSSIRILDSLVESSTMIRRGDEMK